MEVTYLINSDFAMRGAGTGNVAYNAVRGIYKHKILKKVIVRDYRETEIKKDLIVKPVPFGSFFPRILTGIHLHLVHNFPSSVYNDIIFDRLSLKYIDECDIFHSWNVPIKCMQKAKRIGAVAVIDGASSHPITQNNLLEEEFKKYKIDNKTTVYRAYMKLIIKAIDLSDFIFVPSDFVYQSYVDNNVPEEKLIKIPFGVNLQNFTTIKNKEDDTFRAVFVGQIELRKGVQYLLEAWSKLNIDNSELILRGRIHPDARKIVEHYRNKINLKTPGYGDTRQDYSKSDIFIFPSIEEGSALVSYEAMASGLPVIVTFNTGSVARDGKDGFVIPIRDVDILTEKIKYFYDNPKEIKRMGENAREQVEKYTWDNYGENIVKAYKEIIS